MIRCGWCSGFRRWRIRRRSRRISAGAARDRERGYRPGCRALRRAVVRRERRVVVREGVEGMVVVLVEVEGMVVGGAAMVVVAVGMVVAVLREVGLAGGAAVD